MDTSRIPIVLGYMLILILIATIGYAYYNEEQTLVSMETESRNTNNVRCEINRLNMRLTSLTMMGETAFEWTETERGDYRQERMHIDSTLCEFSRIFISEAADIDSLRILLEDKEKKLLQLAEIYRCQKSLGDEMANKLPVIARQIAKEEPKKPKRKGFLGIFGKKEEPEPSTTTTILSFNRSLMAERRAQNDKLKAQADSLSQQNRILNIRLQNLISYLDGKAQADLRQQELVIAATREESYRDIGVLTAITLLMLFVSFVIIHRDMQRRDRNKKKLEESIRQNRSLLEMRKKIILTISHDIRGPLNVISGSAELAIDTRDKRKRDGYLNNARYLCRHVVHLLNNLLDVYRLNEAKEIPNNVPFRLNVLFDRIAIGATQIINDKGLLFKHDYRNIDVTVTGDEDRIEQIADNLLSNVVKFTQSGSVGIAASYDGDRLVMDISDTGIGMSEETVDRIFRPFERADNVEHIEGFGLGLSITKGLITMLGGTIDVISNVGKGTTFHIAIPLELTGNIETADIQEAKPAGVSRLPHNVIVIDDDPLQRDIVSEMLERNAVSCAVCATASDVVKAMRERDFDLILTDINMPGTNGFALIELLRKSNIGNSRTIPIVAMTARDDDDSKPLLKRGFSGCIFKPFSMQELLERISMVMEKPMVPDDVRIDFSPLVKNVTEPVKILKGLSESTSTEIAVLKKNIGHDDRNGVSAILHRIKPVWEMLGIESCLQPLRKSLWDRNSTPADIKKTAAGVITAMENLIENINEELKRIRDEEQNTDS